ncbi:MAG: hypothetical protein H0W90_16215 [Actinobacteria bacterium]|nr:hypothetical protein [Actinomycetota bacterium]
MLFVLLRELGRVYLRASDSFQRDGIDIGEQLPQLGLTLPSGDVVTLSSLLRSKYVVLISATTGCSICHDVVGFAHRWSDRSDEISTVVLLNDEYFDGFEHANGAIIARADPADIRSSLLIRVSPFVYIATASGRVLAKGLVNNNNQLKRLLRHARGEFGRLDSEGSRAEDEVPDLVAAS